MSSGPPYQRAQSIVWLAQRDKERKTVNVEKHIEAGNLEAALEELQKAILSQPGRADLRLYLFQLLSILGDWKQALTQLNAVAVLNQDAMFLVRIYRQLLKCEAIRAEVFAGHREPLLFGEPGDWLATLMRSMKQTVKGNGAQASALVMEAMERVIPRSGTINDEPFSWFSDADRRLGPLFEIILDGKYHWISISNIAEISFSAPEHLQDLVWLPVQVKWVNGESSRAYMPTRYPGPATVNDAQSALARKTDWTDIGEGFHTGSGQRVFTTENDEYSILQTRRIVFEADAR